MLRSVMLPAYLATGFRVLAGWKPDLPMPGGRSFSFGRLSERKLRRTLDKRRQERSAHA